FTHSYFCFFFFIIHRPPISTLFPYTTLFRSIYFQERKFDKAVPALRQAIKLNPRLVKSATLLAISLSELGRYSEALPGLEKSFQDRKSTRLNSSHVAISYAVFCLKKKKNNKQ